jgi:hypothetical protein
MYKVYYVTTNDESNNAQTLNKIKMFKASETIYQVLRDIDFMLKIDKDETKNTPKNLKFKLIKHCDDNSYKDVGDFYFEVSHDMLNSNDSYKILYNEQTYDKKYIMSIKISHYKDENNGEINFYIAHPSVEIVLT